MIERVRSFRDLTLLWVLLWTLAVGSAGAVGPDGLGAAYDATGTNLTFRVYSSRATRLEVWIYATPFGEAEKAKFALSVDPAKKIWSKTVPIADLQIEGVGETVYYGYRAWGPNWPFEPAWTKGSTKGFMSDVDSDGNRFNPNKLLLDPYALEVSHDPRMPGQLNDAPYFSGAQRATDTGGIAPKGIVLKPLSSAADAKPTRPFKDEIIYEVHLRGFTMLDESIPAEFRGTYAGAARKAAYLKSLGVTAVEFLPGQEFQNAHNDVMLSAQGDNYWGYDPLNYFAPDRRYAADKSPGGPTREFREMTRTFHEQGVKVYLDVVYNHTGEGPASGGDGARARLLSFRGLDNPTYYELAGDRRFYRDNNGVGPNVNCANLVVRQLIIDSLTYWKDALGVDGFRFDLASVLGNVCAEGCFMFNKFEPQNALNRAVRELPARPATGGEGVDLIAEPWAIGNDTYQLGEFPRDWAEWNDKFRDTFRIAQNKLGIVHAPPAELARRFAGSADKFQDDGRKPWHSVNFLVAHDGFCLRDLYAFNEKKNNQPWPFGPSDGGSDNNLSWDQGGDATLQRQAARTGFALLMLSAGVPMFTGGDEMYRTQFGNNNPYNVDSEKNWLDWTLPARFPRFLAYVKKLLAFRHAHPALRPEEFFTGRDANANGLKDITWLRDDGVEADPSYFDDPDKHFLAYRVDGTEGGDPVSSVYVAYNGWSGDVTTRLPTNLPGKKWFRAADTAAWMEEQDNFENPGGEELMDGATYRLNPRSVLLLIER
jgi:glycogen operon protein